MNSLQQLHEVRLRGLACSGVCYGLGRAPCYRGPAALCPAVIAAICHPEAQAHHTLPKPLLAGRRILLGTLLSLGAAATRISESRKLPNGVRVQNRGANPSRGCTGE
jgi:hypothetical protein